VGAGDRPRQIAREDERSLEDGDEDKVAGGVVAPDLPAELEYARANLFPGEINLAGARIFYVTRFRPYF
jgi:hypothetical protein